MRCTHENHLHCLWNAVHLKVSRNADVPLKINTGRMIGSGQGLSILEIGKTWRYEFGWLEHRPQVNDFVDEVTFAFEDGRDVDLYHEFPCWTAFGLQRGFCGQPAASLSSKTKLKRTLSLKKEEMSSIG